MLNHPQSLWKIGWGRLRRDWNGLASAGVILTYCVVAVLVFLGILGAEYDDLLNPEGYGACNLLYWFGSNFNGQDVFARNLYSIYTAFQVGGFVTLISILVGVSLGSLAGMQKDTWIDQVVVWIFGCFDAIPFYLFVCALSFAMQDHPFAMHLAMVGSLWTQSCKMIRSQVLKLSRMNFVEGAYVLGLNKSQIFFSHILPNLLPLLLVESMITFVTAIKAEAILSFLGLGLKEGISWGLMLAEASVELPAGIYNNLFAAAITMFVLVLALHCFLEALQNALKPRWSV